MSGGNSLNQQNAKKKRFSFKENLFDLKGNYCSFRAEVRPFLAAAVSFFTTGCLVLPTAAYCPPTLLGAASAPVGVDRCPFLNMNALRLFNVSEGFKFFVAFFAFDVVLTARVVVDELPVAVCAEANTVKPKNITVDNITRFIIIPLANYWYKSGAKKR
jgi:hypothetical protein